MKNTRIFDESALESAIDTFMSKFLDETKEAMTKVEKKTHDPILFAIDYNFIGESFNWKNAAYTQAVKQKRTNSIGDLHEILIDLMPGWTRLKHGGGMPDLVCQDKKIIVELKARADTPKASDLVVIYDNLKRNTNNFKYKGYTGLYAHILNTSKKQFSGPVYFTPSDAKQKALDLTLDSKKKPYNRRRHENPRILEVDGAVLWSIVADQSQGIQPPYKQPHVIQKVYEEVFTAMLKYQNRNINSSSLNTLKQLALDNFGQSLKVAKT